MSSATRYYRTTHDENDVAKVFAAEAEHAWNTEVGFVGHMLDSGVENAVTIETIESRIDKYETYCPEEPPLGKPRNIEAKLKTLVEFGLAAEIRDQGAITEKLPQSK